MRQPPGAAAVAWAEPVAPPGVNPLPPPTPKRRGRAGEKRQDPEEGEGVHPNHRGILLKLHSGHLGWGAFLMNSRVG